MKYVKIIASLRYANFPSPLTRIYSIESGEQKYETFCVEGGSYDIN